MSLGLSTRIYGVWRLYVAVERPTTEQRRLTRSWIIEMAPPFRRGRGLRLRVGANAVQVGTCRKNPTSDALRQVGGYNTSAKVEDIARWGK